MKYIIELEDEPMIANSFHQEVDELWKAKGFNSLVFDQNGIKKLTPYTELDRSVIEDEVWEFAKKLISMSGNEVSDMIGYTTNFGEVMYNMTYQEAKARYEEWKQKEEIEVGDELKDDENIRAVVLDILDADYESYEVITENGIVDEWQKGIVVKTGRHFSDIEELLKKMREE